MSTRLLMESCCSPHLSIPCLGTVLHQLRCCPACTVVPLSSCLLFPPVAVSWLLLSGSSNKRWRLSRNRAPGPEGRRCLCEGSRRGSSEQTRCVGALGILTETESMCLTCRRPLGLWKLTKNRQWDYCQEAEILYTWLLTSTGKSEGIPELQKVGNCFMHTEQYTQPVVTKTMMWKSTSDSKRDTPENVTIFFISNHWL